MYAFSIALALQGVKVDLALPPSSLLISQPPADPSLGQAAMFHYTWGTVFNNATGGKVWEFDKRVFTDASIVSQVRVLLLLPVLLHTLGLSFPLAHALHHLALLRVMASCTS